MSAARFDIKQRSDYCFVRTTIPRQSLQIKTKKPNKTITKYRFYDVLVLLLVSFVIAIILLLYCFLITVPVC